MTLKHHLASVIAALVLAGALAGPASAAPKNFDPAQPSWVDINQALDAYRKTTAFAKYQQQLLDKRKALSAELEALAQFRYCTPEEQKEALGLKAKPSLTPKEKDRLAELTKKADAVDNELATLSQKASPTADDTKRIAQLSQMRTDAVKNLAKEEADRRDALRKLESDLMTNVETDLLKIVDKVAKDQKIPTIYERRAVLVGGNDLTDEVVKRLPK